MNRQPTCLIVIATLLVSGVTLPSLLLAAGDKTNPVATSQGNKQTILKPPSPPGLDFKWGVGGAVGWTHNLGRTRVGDVSSPNGIVRIDSDENDLVRPWIEFHTWFKEWKDFDSWVLSCNENYPCAMGPFVGAALGNKFVDAVGIGLMFGKKMGDHLSFNIAVGGALELNSKVLGDGVVANQALPAGESTVRTKDTSLGSLLVLFSVAWDSSKAESSPTTTSEISTPNGSPPPNPANGSPNIHKSEPSVPPTSAPVPTKEWNPEIVRNFIGPIKSVY